jgi:hypothetical protein
VSTVWPFLFQHAGWYYVLEAAQQEARARVLAELGAGVEISEHEVRGWLEKLGAR